MRSVISLGEWMKLYRRIMEYMGFSIGRDYEASLLLAEMLAGERPCIEELERLVAGRVAIVFGAGPPLPRHIRLLRGVIGGGRAVAIAADGASRALLEQGLVPHVVVTDLDGGGNALLRAASMGSIMVVHGHGDNIPALKRLVPLLKARSPRVIGTTQVEPVYPLVNFGGFTDGDRAAYMAACLGARAIVLAGMDLDGVVGRYSKPWLSSDSPASSVKRRKLRVASMLLERLARSFGRLYSLTPVAGGVRVVSIEEARAMVLGQDTIF